MKSLGIWTVAVGVVLLLGLLLAGCVPTLRNEQANTLIVEKRSELVAAMADAKAVIQNEADLNQRIGRLQSIADRTESEISSAAKDVKARKPADILLRLQLRKPVIVNGRKYATYDLPRYHEVVAGEYWLDASVFKRLALYEQMRLKSVAKDQSVTAFIEKEEAKEFSSFDEHVASADSILKARGVKIP